MSEPYFIQVDSSITDRLHPEQSLQNVTDRAVTFRRAMCPAADCALRFTIERAPETVFGKNQTIDLITIDCANDPCEGVDSLRKGQSPIPVLAGLAVITSVSIESTNYQ